MKINQCFSLVAITSLLLVGWLSRSAAAAGPSLRLTPCARATAGQIKLLGRHPDDLEREQALFVEWSKIPHTIFKINFPEAIIFLGRLARSGYAAGFVYVRELQWGVHGTGGWKFDVPLKTDQRNPPTPSPCRIRGWITPAEDHIDLRLQLTNQTRQTLKPQSLFVCTGRNLGKTAARLVTRDYFLRDGGFLPWEPQEAQFTFGPAHIAALTEKGWQQFKWFADRGDTPPIKAHPAADGCRASVIQHDRKEYVVGFMSDDAVILGGKSSHPCQDLALGFGPLQAGESAEVRATWWFLEGGLDDLLARLNVNSQ